jgi:hypothetical protein
LIGSCLVGVGKGDIVSILAFDCWLGGIVPSLSDKSSPSKTIAVFSQCPNDEDSDEEETEWSLLSGKKFSLSRNTSLQYQDLVKKNGNAVSENVAKKVIAAAVNKLSSLGHCENTAIVLDGDDLSDSDGTSSFIYIIFNDDFIIAIHSTITFIVSTK